MLDVAFSSKVSSTSEFSLSLVCFELSSTEYEKDDFESLKLANFVPSSIFESTFSIVLGSNSSFIDFLDLTEEFDIVELMDVCLDIGVNPRLEDGR